MVKLMNNLCQSRVVNVNVERPKEKIEKNTPGNASPDLELRASNLENHAELINVLKDEVENGKIPNVAFVIHGYVTAHKIYEIHRKRM